MLEFLVSALAGVPPVIATILLAMVPVGELRGALPVALLVYKLPVVLAVTLSILGNMLPIFIVLAYVDSVMDWLSARSKLAKKFFDWLFERTRHKLSVRVEKYGYWALALFVAVPLPVTGAWTGALAVFVFGLPKKRAMLAILVGVCISATIVTAISLGGLAVFTKFLS